MSGVADVYDRIAAEYRESKLLGFREAIEAETLRRLQGDLTGLSVVDLACGEGHYTRRLRLDGAADVLGVDISPEMIRLAQEAEERSPIGCRYLVADAADVALEQPVDLVVAVYLLNYATSAGELDSFVEAAFRILRQGGRFIGFNDNPNSDPNRHGSMAQYGFERTLGAPRREGAEIAYRMRTPDGADFGFSNYYLSPETHTRAFEQAGFADFRWEGPDLAEGEKDNDHWDRFMRHAPMIGFSARKP